MQPEQQPLNKKKILIILGIIALATFLAGIFWPRSTTKQSTPPASEKPTSKNNITPTPPFIYDKKSTEQLDVLLARRLQISPADQEVKKELRKISNPLLETKSVSLTYNKKNDTFEAEIHTLWIYTAKQETVAWLKQKGLSDDAICKLPVVFSMSEQDSESLRGLNIHFNPLPIGCMERLNGAKATYARTN